MRSVPKKAAFRTVEQFQRAATPLRKFISGATALKPRQRALIVDQAIMFLESFYAHLPLKSAMYAVDPVRRLRLLRHRLPNIGAKPSIELDLSFHAEMTEIFTSVRDMHTRYFLPVPFQSAAPIFHLTSKPTSMETSASLWRLISPNGVPRPKPPSALVSKSYHGMEFRSHAPSRPPRARAAVAIQPLDVPPA